MKHTRPPVTHAADSCALAEAPDSTAPDVHLDEVGALDFAAALPGEDGARGGDFPWF